MALFSDSPKASLRRRQQQWTAAALLACCIVFTSGSCKNTDTAAFATPSIDGGSDYRNNSDDRPLPPPGDWWTAFNDPDLNRLMRRLEADNPNLRAALARYDRARGELGLAEADRFPSVTGEVLLGRQRDTASGIFVPDTLTYNQYRAALNLDYEIDLWGRVRHSVAAAEDEFEASGTDLAAAALSLKAELARTWFRWRMSREEIDLVERTVQLRKENFDIIDARVRGGESNKLDLARAETELESARALLLQLRREGEAVANALAILVGRSPATFDVPTPRSNASSASVPAGLPAELLQRRPDIAAAESRLHAATERIGLARASYLPRVTLGAEGGLSSLDLNQWFDANALFGAVGPNVSLPIYQGGRAFADRRRARAAATEALANYEAVVLDGFREVETALSDVRYLGREIEAHSRASVAADQAAKLSRERYAGGLVSYLEVIDAERTALDEQLDLTRSRTAKRIATVRLIQALGGGWKKA